MNFWWDTPSQKKPIPKNPNPRYINNIPRFLKIPQSQDKNPEILQLSQIPGIKISRFPKSGGQRKDFELTKVF